MREMRKVDDLFYQVSKLKETIAQGRKTGTRVEKHNSGTEQNLEMDPLIYGHLNYDKGDAAEQQRKDGPFNKCCQVKWIFIWKTTNLTPSSPHTEKSISGGL